MLGIGPADLDANMEAASVLIGSEAIGLRGIVVTGSVGLNGEVEGGVAVLELGIDGVAVSVAVKLVAGVGKKVLTLDIAGEKVERVIDGE